MSEITPELEAVAIALWRNDDTGCDWEDHDDDERAFYISQARAALSAIREPTARMSRAVLAEHMKGNSSFTDEYRAAIDAILSDTRTPTEGDLL